MAIVPHVTSGLGLGKFQADGFLLTRVYVGIGSRKINFISFIWIISHQNMVSVDTTFVSPNT